MAKSENKKRTWRDKYRFSVIDDTTFEEIWRIRLTQYSAFILISLLVLFIVGATSALIAFTSLREFIPGYPSVTMRRNILLNAIRLDSLDYELAKRDRYFASVSAVIQGKQPPETAVMYDTSRDYSSIRFSSSPADSTLRAMIEQEEQFNITQGLTANNETATASLSELHFYPPVKGGIISGRYDIRTKHFGTDIVTNPRALVSAALDGVVVFTGWTMETGYVTEVQHSNNIVTIYKHNATLLKETGDPVRTGEPISVVGDSGELYTSGPHLHFEIWYKGNPLDPEKHVIF
ncbi:MAG: M23 family metallopeptidase [Bacteroidales bacterium]|jgi:murein DD-endopeptidase MepM/ murein hydrolase activator NlpD|nr:M23 family metallopeptidase [Bacteroidales bacterium]